MGASGVRRGSRGRTPPDALHNQESAPNPRAAGKRKAEDRVAQHAKQGQHVLKRKDKAPSCPLCHSATILACDKLEAMSLPELKMLIA